LFFISGVSVARGAPRIPTNSKSPLRQEWIGEVPTQARPMWKICFFCPGLFDPFVLSGEAFRCMPGVTRLKAVSYVSRGFRVVFLPPDMILVTICGLCETPPAVPSKILPWPV